MQEKDNDKIKKSVQTSSACGSSPPHAFSFYIVITAIFYSGPSSGFEKWPLNAIGVPRGPNARAGGEHESGNFPPLAKEVRGISREKIFKF